jgi:hypothetical protein
MRRTRVALIVNVLWLAAFAVGGACLLAFGINWLTVGVTVVAGAAAFGFGAVIAQAIERDVQLKLAQLGKAVGVANGRDLRDGMSIEAIVANLAGRLERASQFKAALAGLAEPVAVVSADGEIIGTSSGLSAIQ